jgi:cation diffusion facilitator family transporter
MTGTAGPQDSARFPESSRGEGPAQAAEAREAGGAGEEGRGEPGQPTKPGQHGRIAVLAALAANLGIAATKLVAFFVTASASMLAESVHSLADSGNQILLLLGRNRARRSETELHPFGYGQERYFYAFIVAVVIFVVGALFSGYEGIHRILHPEKITSPVVAFVVLGVAVGLESFSLRTAVSESNRTRGRIGWRSFIRRAKAPELPAVLLEDVAALAGLLLALIGVVLATITNDDRWDGAGSLAIGVLLACVAGVLAVEMKSLLIGESGRSRPGRRSSASSICGRCTSDRRLSWSRRRSACATMTRPPASRTASTRLSGASGRQCPSPSSSSSNPTSTRSAGRTSPTRRSGRPGGRRGSRGGVRQASR